MQTGPPEHSTPLDEQPPKPHVLLVQLVGRLSGRQARAAGFAAASPGLQCGLPPPRASFAAPHWPENILMSAV